MKKDYIYTFVTEMSVMLCSVIVYKIAAIYLHGDGFSEYALSMRTVGLILPALLLGLGVAIPRYVAMARAGSKGVNDAGYFIAGMLLCVGSAMLLIVVSMIVRGQISSLLFGTPEYSYLLMPIAVMIIGMIVHSICYGYYRGRLLMSRANLLQFINSAVIPLLIFVWIRNSTANVLLFTGIAMTIVSFLFVGEILLHMSWSNIGLMPKMRELFSYGISRVMGDFGLAAIMTIPAYIVTHKTGMREGGYVAFGISLMKMVANVFAPIGLILLPKASSLISSGNMKALKRHSLKLLQITVVTSTVGVIVFEIFASQIVRLYLGEGYDDIVRVARILMVGAVAYAIYVSMRSVIDAYCVKAINTHNIVLSLILYICLSLVFQYAGLNYIYYVAGLLLSFALMAALTLYRMNQIFRSVPLTETVQTI